MAGTRALRYDGAQFAAGLARAVRFSVSTFMNASLSFSCPGRAWVDRRVDGARRSCPIARCRAIRCLRRQGTADGRGDADRASQARDRTAGAHRRSGRAHRRAREGPRGAESNRRPAQRRSGSRGAGTAGGSGGAAATGNAERGRVGRGLPRVDTHSRNRLRHQVRRPGAHDARAHARAARHRRPLRDLVDSCRRRPAGGRGCADGVLAVGLAIRPRSAHAVSSADGQNLHRGRLRRQQEHVPAPPRLHADQPLGHRSDVVHVLRSRKPSRSASTSRG